MPLDVGDEDDNDDDVEDDDGGDDDDSSNFENLTSLLGLDLEISCLLPR